MPKYEASVLLSLIELPSEEVRRRSRLWRTIIHERQYTQANEEGEPINIANFRYNKRFTYE
jgi:hypothetical protein